jgi:hypothetical protein
VIVIIMEHECEWGTVWGNQWEWSGKERILKGEEDWK